MKQAHSIPFNKPLVLGTELAYVTDAINRAEFSAGGYYTKLCEQKLQSLCNSEKVLLTSSCTHALEICGLLLDLEPGDEIIMPSYTFVSSANAFVLRGAKIKFVDIHSDTMNIDETKIEAAISPKTKAILVMHYAGYPCHMGMIMQLAEKHNLFVIEDAAQCIDSYYEGKHLGTIGHLGTISFHATKNLQCGEAGALIINDSQFSDQAEIIREKGTNRRQFLEGRIDKYSWVGIGSSYLTSELNAAYLAAQLENCKQITNDRLKLMNQYRAAIASYNFNNTDIEFYLHSPNAHIIYLITQRRDELLFHLNTKGIKTAFHYVPLHSSLKGKETGSFVGTDKFTSELSSSLLRLPMFAGLNKIDYIIQSIFEFSTQ